MVEADYPPALLFKVFMEPYYRKVFPAAQEWIKGTPVILHISSYEERISEKESWERSRERVQKQRKNERRAFSSAPTLGQLGRAQTSTSGVQQNLKRSMKKSERA